MKRISNINWIFLGLTATLFCIVLFKAVTLSMTHDESASFYFLNEKNILGYLFRSDVWPNANNHWFNTLSFQFFTSIFGPKEWAIRLFNVLSFLIYSIYSIKLAKCFDKNSTQIFAMGLLLLNPYVLDFFSLARGYGLSLAFSTGAIYHCIKFIKSDSLKDLIISCVYLLIGTLSLFSTLILFPALLGPLALFLFIKYFKNWNNPSFYKPFLVVILATLFTMAITYIPLKALSLNAEFKWGVPTLSECFQSLINNSSYGKKYVPNNIFLTGVLFSFLVYAYYKFYLSIKSIDSIKTNPILSYILSSFLFLIIGMVLSKYLLGTYYPVDRKTIMFIPFLALILASIFSLNKSKIIRLVEMGLTMILILHFILSFQKDQVREWWYDRDTKDFIALMSEDAGNNKYSIGCNWHFHPTLSFYSKTKYSDQASVMSYNKNIVSDKSFDYYMCFDSDLKLLEQKYHVLHKNKSGRLLLKLND